MAFRPRPALLSRLRRRAPPTPALASPVLAPAAYTGHPVAHQPPAADGAHAALPPAGSNRHHRPLPCRPELPLDLPETAPAAASRRTTDPMAETEVRTVTFEQEVITTTVTSSGRAVDRWITEILSVHRPGGTGYDMIVGLDVEWRPSFSSAQNPAATLQLCVDRRCLVFQLLHADFFPAALDRFLGDRTVRFFGVGVAADASRLRADHGLEVANAVDLRGRVAEHMDRPDLRQAGLRAIAGAFLGTDPVKPRRVTMSRWDARRLSNDQIRYACVDAFVSSEVARKLQRDQQVVMFAS